jgi:hypothetical protein
MVTFDFPMTEEPRRVYLARRRQHPPQRYLSPPEAARPRTARGFGRNRVRRGSRGVRLSDWIRHPPTPRHVRTAHRECARFTSCPARRGRHRRRAALLGLAPARGRRSRAGLVGLTRATARRRRHPASGREQEAAMRCRRAMPEPAGDPAMRAGQRHASPGWSTCSRPLRHRDGAAGSKTLRAWAAKSSATRLSRGGRSRVHLDYPGQGSGTVGAASWTSRSSLECERSGPAQTSSTRCSGRGRSTGAPGSAPERRFKAKSRIAAAPERL